MNDIVVNFVVVGITMATMSLFGVFTGKAVRYYRDRQYLSMLNSNQE